jgi:hypothetical protein
MYFKKVALLSGLTLWAGSIVVPAGSSVNRHRTKGTKAGTTQTPGDGGFLADGMPLPPLPPAAAA